MGQDMNATLEWALHYAEHGYRVIPIRPGEKRPPMGAWQDVATTQTGTLTAWYTGQYADHGIGIVTGELANGDRYIVLDIDTKNHDGTGTGIDSLTRLTAKHGPLPDTIEATTGSGGRHLLYRLPHDAPEIGNGAGRYLGTGIDVRAHNAQIVVAPTTHPNGTQYAWVTGHGIGEIDMAPAPAWLIRQLTPPTTTTAVNSNTSIGTLDDTRPGSRFNRSTNWDSLLTADGWTPHHHDPTTDTYYWTRPNKHSRDGISATVNHKGNDCLTVFSTSIRNLPPGTYDRFGYWTQTRHGGNFTDAARQLAQQQDDTIGTWVASLQQDSTPQLDITTDDTDDHDPLATWYIDWPTLWATEQTAGEWLCEPILAKGRAHALYAGAKSGKSLMLLEIAAAVATGRAALGMPAQPPRAVLYIDYEMTASDVRDRLEAFGYGKDDNLEHLHYVLLPSIAGLDTKAGAEIVIAAIQRHQIELVIIDTTARAVEGEENDADTMRAFYRWTGVAMKALGVTWVRADHAGKDTSKGQRGSSAKNDDVDVVWRFTKRNSTSILLEATHRRMAWVPDKVEVELREIDGRLAHSTLGEEMSSAALELVAHLDRLHADLDISSRAARQLLKDNGVRAASEVLRSALRHRKEKGSGDRIVAWVQQFDDGTSSGTYDSDDGTLDLGTYGGTPAPTATRRHGTPPAHSGTPTSGAVPSVPRSIERHTHGTPTSEQPDGWL